MAVGYSGKVVRRELTGICAAGHGGIVPCVCEIIHLMDCHQLHHHELHMMAQILTEFMQGLERIFPASVPCLMPGQGKWSPELHTCCFTYMENLCHANPTPAQVGDS